MSLIFLRKKLCISLLKDSLLGHLHVSWAVMENRRILLLFHGKGIMTQKNENFAIDFHLMMPNFLLHLSACTSKLLLQLGRFAYYPVTQFKTQPQHHVHNLNPCKKHTSFHDKIFQYNNLSFRPKSFKPFSEVIRALLEDNSHIPQCSSCDRRAQRSTS